MSSRGQAESAGKSVAEINPPGTPGAAAPSVSRRTLILVHLSLLLVAVSWGSNFASIKYLLRSLGPAEVLLIRLIGASLCFTVALAITGGIPRIPRADWPKVGLMALLGITVNTTATAFGTWLIPAAVASMVTAGNPIFTALIARLFLGEPLTRRKIVGIALAFAGFLVVLFYGGSEAQFSVKNTFGVLVMVCAPLAWAFYTVLSKPLIARYDPGKFAGLVTIVGTLPLLPLLLVHRDLVSEVRAFEPLQWLATMMMAVFALVLAYTLWYRGLRVLAPTQVAIYIYLVPVFGTLIAWLVLGERITIFLLFGGLMILSGVIVTNTTRRGPIDRINGRLRAGLAGRGYTSQRRR